MAKKKVLAAPAVKKININNIWELINSDLFADFLSKQINLVKKQRTESESKMRALNQKVVFKADAYSYCHNNNLLTEEKLKQEFVLIIQKKSFLTSLVREFIVRNILNPVLISTINFYKALYNPQTSENAN